MKKTTKKKPVPTAPSAIARQLHSAAVKAQTHAYAPYSGYKIGSAVVLQDGSVHVGCNVENASYGGTVCAERVAIFSAVSSQGTTTGKGIKIQELCVVSDADQPWPPCGFCRQVLAEFASANSLIHIANREGICKTFRLQDLLPEAFGPGFLDK